MSLKLNNCKSCKSNRPKSIYSIGTQKLIVIFPLSETEKI